MAVFATEQSFTIEFSRQDRNVIPPDGEINGEIKDGVIGHGKAEKR